MATMTFPMHNLGDVEFEVVEDVEFMNRMARVASRAGLAARLFWKTVLVSYGFAQVVGKQENLIETLNGPAIQNFDTDRLNDLAGRIEHLVTLNENLLACSTLGRFRPWTELLSQISAQRDTLDSLAQSFRSAADPEHQVLLVSALELLYT
jgi:hypothetical protein